jgi:transcriptional regulator with XRE-family HTH domain
MQDEICDSQIGARLKSIRNELKLNQNRLGKLLNVSQGAVSRVEGGVQKLDAVMLAKLNNLYDININWLLTNKGSKFATSPGQPKEDASTASKLNKRVNEILSSGNQDAIALLKVNIKNLKRTIEKERKQQEEIEAIKRAFAELKKKVESPKNRV